MTSRRKRPVPPTATPTTDASGSPLCPACLSPDHQLRGCNTPRAVTLLVEQGCPMSAHEVTQRIQSKERS